MLKQQQNLGQRFGTSKMHLSPPVALADERYKAVVLLLMIRCWLLLPLLDSVIVLCFVVRYFVSILVLQPSELVAMLCLSSWCLVIVVWLFLRMPWFVCSLWLWYFMIILTYYFWSKLFTNLISIRYYLTLKTQLKTAKDDTFSDIRPLVKSVSQKILFINQNICCGYT